MEDFPNRLLPRVGIPSIFLQPLHDWRQDSLRRGCGNSCRKGSGGNGVLGPPSDFASERPLESHRARKCYWELLISEDGFYDGVVCTVHSEGVLKQFESEVRHLEPGAFTM